MGKPMAMYKECIFIYFESYHHAMNAYQMGRAKNTRISLATLETTLIFLSLLSSVPGPVGRAQC